MSQMIQRKQTRIHLSKGRLILSVLLLALILWPQPKIAQAQWVDIDTNLYTMTDNVGIGTTTPINKLQVAGNIDTTDGADRKLILRSSTNYNYALQTTGDDFQIIEAPGSSGAVRLHIDYPTGNVGIGTTNPTDALYIERNTSGTVGVRIKNPNATGVDQYGALFVGGQSTPIALWNNSTVLENAVGGNLVLSGYNGTIIATTGESRTERLRIDSAGNVGIGTTNPNAKLDIKTTGQLINFDNGSGSIGNIDWGGGGADNRLIIRAAAGKVLSLGAGHNFDHLYIDTTGKIGIGTTSPAAKLHVAGGSGSDIAIDALGKLIINNGAGGNNYIVASTNTVNPRMDFYTASAHRMTVDYGGNVGIGTTTPSVRLEVAGNQIFGGRGIAGSNLALTHISSGEVASEAILRFGYWYSAGSYNAAIWDIKRKADNSLGFAYMGSGVEDSTKSMYISNAGNVGIGTMNPSTKLEVAGDITASGNIAAKYQDVAEWVPSPIAMPAGTVVTLDIEHSNQVLPSVRSYDTRVAGVISEMPGILLGEAGDGKVKVATTGRVKVKVDATKRPVQVGDLLVTSDKEGVAMKSEPLDLGGVPIHRPGTLIGKALEPLSEGEGEILVLLSLQ